MTSSPRKYVKCVRPDPDLYRFVSRRPVLDTHVISVAEVPVEFFHWRFEPIPDSQHETVRRLMNTALVSAAVPEIRGGEAA